MQFFQDWSTKAIVVVFFCNKRNNSSYSLHQASQDVDKQHLNFKYILCMNISLQFM